MQCKEIICGLAGSPSLGQAAHNHGLTAPACWLLAEERGCAREQDKANQIIRVFFYVNKPH
jgi:hypothetical protein